MTDAIKYAQDALFMYYGMHLLTFKHGLSQKKDKLYFKARGLVVHDRILSGRKP